jgi:hypothetical protein
VTPDQQSIAEGSVFELKRDVLGHGRVEEIRYLIGDRPLFIARRAGRVVGMAFGASRVMPARDKGRETGPMCALDPTDLPALIATVENDAVANGIADLGFQFPLSKSTSVSWALGRRYRIDPFYTLILASDDRMRLDRWVQTATCLATVVIRQTGWLPFAAVARVTNASSVLAVLVILGERRRRRERARGSPDAVDVTSVPVRQAGWRIITLLLVLAVLDVAGVSLWLAGIQVGPTWLVGLTSSFAPLVGILGGVLLFRERPRRLQWVGVAMVLGGGVLLAVA